MRSDTYNALGATRGRRPMRSVGSAHRCGRQCSLASTRSCWEKAASFQQKQLSRSLDRLQTSETHFLRATVPSLPNFWRHVICRSFQCSSEDSLDIKSSEKRVFVRVRRRSASRVDRRPSLRIDRLNRKGWGVVEATGDCLENFEVCRSRTWLRWKEELIVEYSREDILDCSAAHHCCVWRSTVEK